MALNWQNLVGKGEGEEVEEFLWNTDIGSVIFTVDSTIIKNALLGSIAKFEKYPDIQSRCFQLLQDCHLLSPPGVLNEELSGRYDAILRSLSSWINKSDVVLNCLQFLSMVADHPIMKARSILQEESELLALVNRAIIIHAQAVDVQRAALQLFEAIIEHAPRTGTALYAVSSRIFKPVLDNLLLKGDDLSICFSSFSILLSLSGHARGLITPWTDQLINICIETLVRRKSPEICAKCLSLLQTLTEDREALFTIAKHSHGLTFFVDSLATLRSFSHITAANACLQLLTRVLEDYDIALSAFQTLPTEFIDEPVQFATWFKEALKEAFERYMSYIQQHTGETEQGKEQEKELTVQGLFIQYAMVDEMLNDMMLPEDSDNQANPDPDPDPDIVAIQEAEAIIPSAEVIGSLPQSPSHDQEEEEDGKEQEKEEARMKAEKSHIEAKELVAQLQLLSSEQDDQALPPAAAVIMTEDEMATIMMIKGEPEDAIMEANEDIIIIDDHQVVEAVNNSVSMPYEKEGPSIPLPIPFTAVDPTSSISAALDTVETSTAVGMVNKPPFINVRTSTTGGGGTGAVAAVSPTTTIRRIKTQTQTQPTQAQTPQSPAPHPLQPGTIIIKASYLQSLQSSLITAQTQTTQALTRSSQMHKLFKEAAVKIEELLFENETLMSRLVELQEIQRESEKVLEQEKKLRQEQYLKRTKYFANPMPEGQQTGGERVQSRVLHHPSLQASTAPSTATTTTAASVNNAGQGSKNKLFRSPLNAVIASNNNHHQQRLSYSTSTTATIASPPLSMSMSGSLPRHVTQPRPRWNGHGNSPSVPALSVMAQPLPMSPVHQAGQAGGRGGFFRTYSGGSKAFKQQQSQSQSQSQQAEVMIMAQPYHSPPHPPGYRPRPHGPPPPQSAISGYQYPQQSQQQSLPRGSAGRGHPMPGPRPYQQRPQPPQPPAGMMPMPNNTTASIPTNHHHNHGQDHSQQHAHGHGHGHGHGAAAVTVGLIAAGSDSILEEHQHNLAVAGLLEGLDQVTLRRRTINDNSSGKGGGIVEMNSSNLGSQSLHITTTTTTTASPHRRRQPTAATRNAGKENEEEEDEAVSPLDFHTDLNSPYDDYNNQQDEEDEDDIESHTKEIEALGDLVRLLFQHLFETQAVSHSPHSLQHQLHSNIIPLRRLRTAMEAMGLLDHHNLTIKQIEVIFNQFRSKHVTLFGTAFALVLCGKRRFPQANGMNLLRAIQGLLGVYIQSLHEQQEHQESIMSALSEPLGSKPVMSKREFDEVLKVFDREKKAFATLYEAYAPWVDTEHRKLPPTTTSNANAAANAANAAAVGTGQQHQLVNNGSIDLSESQSQTQQQQMMPKRIALLCPPDRYSLGYNHPGGLSLPGLLLFAKEFHVLPHLVSRAQLVEVLHAAADPYYHNKAKELVMTARSASLDPDYSPSSAAVTSSVANIGGDHALSFPQFLDFILQLALRCPVFLRADNSPRVKLSNFLQLLNLSPGKDIVARRSRGEMVIFRPLMEPNQYHPPSGFTSRGQPLQIGYIQETAAVVDPKTGAIVQVKRRKRIGELRDLIIKA